MNNLTFVLLLFLFIHNGVITSCEDDLKQPTVLIGILIRNKAHTLPYFLTCLERLSYPKDRISLWIRSDNNIDNSIEIFNVWLKDVKDQYHSAKVILDNQTKGFDDEEGPSDWSNKRFSHVIKLREEILNYARQIWADYIFMLDADAFLTNPNTLKQLISKRKTVIAPMLKSDGMYSNFWAGMTSEFYYQRTEQYKPILNYEETGCHEVPMIHSAVLINLKKKESDLLTYDSENLRNYDGPRDDIITFALSVNFSKIPLFVCNDGTYGFIMVPLENDGDLEMDYQQLTNLKVDILSVQNRLEVSNTLQRFITYPKKDTLGMDRIFMINLARRPERRIRMNYCFEELGINAEIVDAVDGKKLNSSILNSMGITLLPEYQDPYHKRPMKMGEIGCFLSHYKIWTEVVEKGYQQVMVLEDDVRFEPFFRNKVHYVMKDLRDLKVAWDLVYLGRKRLQEEGEPFLEGSKRLVYAGYSYWTLGYILSNRGAKKLLEPQPLTKLIPVDEYLPVVFDKHPTLSWKSYFPKRDLIALSASPLLIYPTHYTGEKDYVSDTENSTLVSDFISEVEQKVEL